jgi:hypothetical protein
MAISIYNFGWETTALGNYTLNASFAYLTNGTVYDPAEPTITATTTVIDLDYEEGDYDPVSKIYNDPTITITDTLREGYYVRIGKSITVTMNVAKTAADTWYSSEPLAITLPYHALHSPGGPLSIAYTTMEMVAVGYSPNFGRDETNTNRPWAISIYNYGWKTTALGNYTLNASFAYLTNGTVYDPTEASITYNTTTVDLDYQESAYTTYTKIYIAPEVTFYNDPSNTAYFVRIGKNVTVTMDVKSQVASGASTGNVSLTLPFHALHKPGGTLSQAYSTTGSGELLKLHLGTDENIHNKPWSATVYHTVWSGAGSGAFAVPGNALSPLMFQGSLSYITNGTAYDPTEPTITGNEVMVNLDYQEGSWTPVGTVHGSEDPFFNYYGHEGAPRFGYYVRIGRHVTTVMDIKLHSNVWGPCSIAGLPFWYVYSNAGPGGVFNEGYSHLAGSYSGTRMLTYGSSTTYPDQRLSITIYRGVDPVQASGEDYKYVGGTMSYVA